MPTPRRFGDASLRLYALHRHRGRGSSIVSYEQRDWNWDSIASLARAHALPVGHAGSGMSHWFRAVLHFGTSFRTSVMLGFETQRDPTETLSDARARRYCAAGGTRTHTTSTPDTKSYFLPGPPSEPPPHQTHKSKAHHTGNVNGYAMRRAPCLSRSRVAVLPGP